MEELFEIMRAVENHNIELSRMLIQFAEDMSMLLMEVAKL